MKILVSAIACDPYQGSESFVGWSAVSALAEDHELWVLTGRRNQPILKRASAEGLIPANVHFIFAGEFQPWHPNRMRAQLQGWREYQRFSRDVLPVARELHAREKFDLVHHVTFATWRVGSPLWRLGIPFVFGPVGGNTNVPARLLPSLSTAAIGYELLRNTSNLISRLSPSVRSCLRHADHVLTSEEETGRLARRIRGFDNGVSILSQAFFKPETLEAFAAREPAREPEGVLKLFAGGSMLGTKGVALALQALAHAKAQGVKFAYRVGNSGAEAPHVQRLAWNLGLTETEVAFAPPLSGLAYRQELWRTHVFFQPSLRESAGLTMMEAMMAGCVPVVADCGGPGFIVTDDCGYKIPTHSQKQMIQQLANTIIAIDRDRNIILEKGRAASQRIISGFSKENYRTKVNAVYKSITGA